MSRSLAKNAHSPKIETFEGETLKYLTMVSVGGGGKPAGSSPLLGTLDETPKEHGQERQEGCQQTVRKVQ
jgi:hypothetical protein